MSYNNAYRPKQIVPSTREKREVNDMESVLMLEREIKPFKNMEIQQSQAGQRVISSAGNIVIQGR